MSFVTLTATDRNNVSHYESMSKVNATSLYQSPEMPEIQDEFSSAPIAPPLIGAFDSLEFPAFANDFSATDTRFKLDLDLIKRDKLVVDGKAFFYGEGVKTDYEKASKLFAEAVALGHTQAPRYLKCLHANQKAQQELGIVGTNFKSLPARVQLTFFLKAAGYGNFEAFCRLGELNENVNLEASLLSYVMAYNMSSEHVHEAFKKFFKRIKKQADKDDDVTDESVRPVFTKAQCCMAVANVYKSVQKADTDEDHEYELLHYKYVEKAACEGLPHAMRLLQLMPNPHPKPLVRKAKDEEIAILPQVLAKTDDVVMLPPAEFI